MSRGIDIHDDYISTSLPADIPDDLIEFLPEDDESLTYEEVIQQQASVYQSYQESREVTTVTDDDHCISDPSYSSENESESSERESVNSQEAMDEAFARSLQDLGEEFDEFFITEFSSNASSRLNEQAHVSSSESSQEDIDPDNMRYEDLLNLTETVGVENVGLSEVQMSQLPTFIYTAGMFSKNMEENCAICQEKFKFGKRVITLPCYHHYHSKCIIRWLKLKKNCPICQKEVV